MTKLDCSVKSCIHNSDNCCCKSSIIVEGEAAKEDYETCCGSFDENEGGMFKNVFKSPESRLEVDCEALNCVYNEDRHCAAEHIGITGDQANESEETQCSSFKSR